MGGWSLGGRERIRVCMCVQHFQMGDLGDERYFLSRHGLVNVYTNVILEN